MAKALQCPACGRKHPVTTLPDAPTFPCRGCGQGLKVPAQFRSGNGAAPAPPSGGTAVLSVPPAPPARPAPPPVARRPVTREPVVGGPEEAPAKPSPAPARGRAARRERDRLRQLGGMPLRVLAWLIAVVLGGIITVYVARKTGWLSGQRLVDVFTGTGLSRYLRVMAIVPVWALVTTVLVTIMIEGSRWLGRARRSVQEQRKLEARPLD